MKRISANTMKPNHSGTGPGLTARQAASIMNHNPANGTKLHQTATRKNRPHYECEICSLGTYETRCPNCGFNFIEYAHYFATRAVPRSQRMVEYLKVLNIDKRLAHNGPVPNLPCRKHPGAPPGSCGSKHQYGECIDWNWEKK
jgi:hypothetical protein